jgi:hypothetical protein
MSDEELSALVDDELSGAARAQALDRLLAEPARQQTWARYHMVGVVIRDAHQLRQPTVVALPQRRRRALLPLSLAAAVAALVLAVSWTRSPIPEPPAVAVAPTTAPDMVDIVAEPASATRRLDGYLLNFNAQRARLGKSGAHPYVHVIGFDEQ